MKKHAIHIYNPETDYALSMGRKEYSMPKAIRKFRDEMELFPATFSSPEDYIAVRSVAVSQANNPKLFELALQRNVKIVEIREIPRLIHTLGKEHLEIRPWGWNHSLRRNLLRTGVDESLLKTDVEIDNLRDLSHRRTSIIFQKTLSSILPDLGIIPATELMTSDEAMSFLKREGDAFFKMPWSSSGRGVVHASGIPEEKLRQWLDGCVKRQGSVMGEPAYHKILDFATEWMVEEGNVIFLGLSLFRTSDEGRYGRNEIIPQNEIDAIISSATPEWGERVIDAQRSVIAEICRNRYVGPVGIDMLATAKGEIVPCVEINFRQTMGMAALNRCRILEEEK